MRARLKVGIIGCGAIGSYIAQSCQKDLSGKIELAAVCDIVASKAEGLIEKLEKEVSILDIDELIKKSDLVMEAASKDTAPLVAEKALSAGKSIMVMSVGGLLGREDLFRLAEKKNANIYTPSGALCGLDALKGAAVAGIKNVTLTTKKPPKGLENAPFVVKNDIDLKKIDKETVIFEGNANEAVEGFPKNVNVAALLSLAGVGAGKTKVRIVVSPSIDRNIHEVDVLGDFGRFSARTENVPFPENPKTSFLAALSAVAGLKSIVDNIKIGT